ncbi:MAG: helix-turn-helix domain-containing protein, partial [Bifidobacteriaceae bacterium]|nr:helix-turn-helix domain-containing protein [Bifidobacteriaceae bacterium]
DAGGSADAEQRRAAERQRFTDAFAVHLSAMNPGAAVAEIGGVAYGLFPVARADLDGEERAARAAGAFLARVGSGLSAVIAIGREARDITGLAQSRVTVERILRVLRCGGPLGPVARMADVQTASLLLELGDLMAARGDQPVGPIATLIAHDAAAGTGLVETLRTWLDTFGDVAAAANRLFIHPNTLRYRLRRIGEISGLDLSDPDARFAAMLQMRIAPAATSSN